MVQQETLAPPVQLAAEGVQLIVGLLAENQTCKNGGTDGRSPAVCVCVCVSVWPWHAQEVQQALIFCVFTVESGESLLCGVGSQCVVRGRKRLSILEVGLPERGNITATVLHLHQTSG